MTIVILNSDWKEGSAPIQQDIILLTNLGECLGSSRLTPDVGIDVCEEK